MEKNKAIIILTINSPKDTWNHLIKKTLRPFLLTFREQEVSAKIELSFKFSGEEAIKLTLVVNKSAAEQISNNINKIMWATALDAHKFSIGYSYNVNELSKQNFCRKWFYKDFSLLIAEIFSEFPVGESEILNCCLYLHLTWVNAVMSNMLNKRELLRAIYSSNTQRAYPRGASYVNPHFLIENQQSAQEIYNEISAANYKITDEGTDWLATWWKLCKEEIDQQHILNLPNEKLVTSLRLIPDLINKVLDISGYGKNVVYSLVTGILHAQLLPAAVKDQSTELTKNDDRALWLDHLNKLAAPVLFNLAEDNLKKNMPLVLSKRIDNAAERLKVGYLEAFGRTLSGIAPWLNSEEGDKMEIELRNRYREWTLKALANAVNPKAKDYLKWDGWQPLVDASYLALAIIRCPWIWHNMDNHTKTRLIKCLESTRDIMPVYTNWILFSGMIEAFFCKYGIKHDAVRIEYGIREFTSHWYVGDGLYSDGMHFHHDYYNSFVIHPYLANIIETIGHGSYAHLIPKIDLIANRYAEILERMIHTDGSYPVIGRSVVYRAGAFHHLADLAVRKKLPGSLPPSQIRSALTAVIKKTFASPLTFTEDGWLNIGVYGHQPDLAEFYITTGSLYLCANIFLPLGLPIKDYFWAAPFTPWTSQRIWSGSDHHPDQAMDTY